MNHIFLIPSMLSSATLLSATIYLILTRSRRPYILPLALIFVSTSIWNVGILMLNLTDGEEIWAYVATLGLIFIPPIIFHFSATYTEFFRKRLYLLSYIPSILLSFLLLTGYYVKDIVYRKIGFEPIYYDIPFYINSWVGLFFTLFSTWLLYIAYKRNVGIKKRQALYILIAIPSNALLSFLSYEAMVNTFNMAQFPLGSMLDFVTISLILYAILKFKLSLESASEVDFRILAETASEGICIVDSEGVIEYANNHFCELLNLPERKIMGRKFLDILDKESAKEFRLIFRNILKGKKVMGVELILEGDGRTTTAEMNASPIIWNGEVIGAFVTIRDIEERKRIEEELRKQKTYFQSLFKDSPEAIVSMDKNHRVMDINPAFEDLFGYTLDELKGKDIDDFILPESEKEKGKAITSQVINGKVVKGIEGERMRKDGSTVHVSIMGAPVFVDGKQVGIFGIYRDITERKKAEEEREFYNSLLRHDIANKNTIIYGNLEMLLDTKLSKEQKEMIKDALNAVKSSNELIATIRELHRLKGERELQELNLHEIIADVVKSLTQQAKSKGIEIRYKPFKAKVVADTFLKNVFTNLIQNAINHSGCSVIKVYGTETKRGGQAFYRISVEDNGKGIPEEIKGKIFSIGVKGKESGGSGLGLYLVKKIVESYGGHIDVRKGKDGGTIFDVYLPKIT